MSWGRGEAGTALRQRSLGAGGLPQERFQLWPPTAAARSTLLCMEGARGEHAGSSWLLLGDDGSREAAAVRHVGMLYSEPVTFRGRGCRGPPGGSGDTGVTMRKSFSCKLHLCAPLSTDLCQRICSLSCHPAGHGPTCVIPGSGDPLWWVGGCYGAVPWACTLPWGYQGSCLPAWGWCWRSRRTPLVPGDGV